MEKRKSNNSVSISRATIKAINKMLFSETGVDMTPIIEDLSMGLSDDKDIISMNVALTMKGFRPSIEEVAPVAKCRFGEKLTPKAYSLLTGVISYTRTSNRGSEYDEHCSLEEWECFNDWEDEPAE